MTTGPARDRTAPLPSALAYVRSRMAASGGTIYLGEGARGWVVPGPERSALVLGPPRSGKTSAVVVPSVLAAPGPVLSTSTKLDVLAASAGARGAVGTCWLYDPSATVRAPDASVVPLRWSPVASSTAWDGAVSAAHSLVATARPGVGVTEGTHWSERAEALLAPLLHAAALRGAPIDRVVQWVNRHEASHAAAILEEAGAGVASDVLAGIAATDSRERSGIFSTAAGALSAYRSESAASAAREPNFDPGRFVASSDTVYICAPAHDQAALAPLVVGLVTAITTAVAARASMQGPAPGSPKGPALLLALDEVANIAPLPTLPTIVSEGGSQGVVSLACVQDLSQVRARWGPSAEGFLTLFSSTLVLPGLADLRTLELVSALAGNTRGSDRSVTTRGWAGGSITRGARSRPRLPVDQVAAGRPGHALAIGGGEAPSWVRLTPWFSTSPWREATAEAGRQEERDGGRPFRSSGIDGAAR